MQPVTRLFLIKPNGLRFWLPGLAYIITMLRSTWRVAYPVHHAESYRLEK